MKKAKTRKNIFTVLSALLSVVFALVTGVTYCLSSLNLTYGVNPNSATAYLGNQQYHIINDTTNNPIPFGDGSRNFEIALKYSYDFEFDVRFKYEIKWYNSDGTTEYKSATNVILQFTNRDNIIYDENYIFIADSVVAGNGKLTFINGVSFVDTSVNQNEYFGKVLKINITEVKIYKAETTYSLSNSYLTKDVTTSEAAQMWIYHKNKAGSLNAYAMVYNYRRSYDYGVPYPGLETAYKKPVATENESVDGKEYVKGYVYGASWAGGNRAYAGVGLYIVTGSSAIKLTATVKGIWRNSSGNITDKSLISENSIRFNFSSNWSHASWDANNLWETTNLTLEIPAKTSCYIELLDNIEITSVSYINNSYNSYRAVANEIILNGNSLTYTEADKYTSFIQIIENISSATVTTNGTYSSSAVSVVNTSTYSNNLYEVKFPQASEQSFNTNLSLINNTSKTQQVTLTYALKYRVSNADTNLTTTINGTTQRAEDAVGEIVNSETYTKLNAFVSGGHYTYVESYGSTTDKTVILAPYSSVSVVEGYTVSNDLQTTISSTLDSSDNGNRTDYYDAWTYLEVTNVSTSEVSETSTTSYNLEIEAVQSGTTVNLYVKNNTNKVVNGVSISGVKIQQMTEEYEYTEDTQYTGIPPKDWVASYWKYYSRSGTEGSYVYTQLTTLPETEVVTAEDGTKSLAFPGQEVYANGRYKIEYYKNEHAYQSTSTIADSTLTIADSTLSKPIQPGESVWFAGLSGDHALSLATNKILVQGTATATSTSEAEDLTLVDNGKSTAYIINNTENSYYVRFTGTITSSVAIANVEVGDVTTVSSCNYYIGIVRPNQIISVPMSEEGTLYSVQETGDYATSDLTGWDSTVVAKFTNLFTIKS